MKRELENIHMSKTIKEQSASVKLIKQQIANALKPVIKQRLDSGVSQKDISKVLDCTQPRVSNLLNDHLELFSLDKLWDFCVRLDLEPKLSIQ